MKRILKRTAIGFAVVMALIQLVPYGRDHSDPPVRAEPEWDSARTERLAMDACGDCHSNETEWPWYSDVAPVSWLVYRDVAEGRETLNFSEWDRPQEEASESAETVIEGSMPPWYFRIVHPEARLTETEKQDLIDGLRATFGSEDD